MQSMNAEDLREYVRKFAEQRIDPDYLRICERDKVFPQEVWEALSEAELHGVAIDEAYGGHGGGVLEQTVIVEELARVMGGMTTMWSINTHSAITLGLHGTEEQKQRLLPRMARGEHRIGLSFTEPDGGTDLLGALKTRARKVEGGYTLSGSKTFTTMVEDVDQLLVLARTTPGGSRTEGLTVFLVPADAPGLTATRLDTLGQAAIGTFLVHYDDVFVPDGDVIGVPDEGWRYLTSSAINHERIIIAALCVGSMAGVIDRTVAYASQRRAFGSPIGKFQAVQHHIANMEIERQAARLLTYRAVELAVAGEDFMLEASIAKAFASEACSRAADLGIQVLGGAGYCSDYHIERIWRDTRIMRIGPISNEMVRNYVAESLGLPRSF